MAMHNRFVWISSVLVLALLCISEGAIQVDKELNKSDIIRSGDYETVEMVSETFDDGSGIDNSDSDLPDPNELPDTDDSDKSDDVAPKKSSKNGLAKSYDSAEMKAAKYLMLKDQSESHDRSQHKQRKHIAIHRNTELDKTVVLKTINAKDRIAVGKSIKELSSKMLMKSRDFDLHNHVTSFAGASHKDGPADMQPIISEVTSYESKLLGEISVLTTDVTRTRQECEKIMSQTKNNISQTSNRILAVQAGIVDFQNQINSRRLDISRLLKERNSYEKNVEVLLSEKSENHADYAERKNRRLKEIEALRKALSLVCTTADFKATPTCASVSSSPLFEFKYSKNESDLAALVSKADTFEYKNRGYWDAMATLDQAIPVGVDTPEAYATPIPTLAPTGASAATLAKLALVDAANTEGLTVIDAAKRLRLHIEQLLAHSKISSSISSIVKSVLVAIDTSDTPKAAQLMSLVMDLKNQMVREQSKETSDWMAQFQEYMDRLHDEKKNMQSVITRMSELNARISDITSRINEDNSNLIEMYSSLDYSYKSLAHENTRCSNAEVNYVTLKSGLSAELVNISKLRSLLRTLQNSSVPRCPYDCSPGITAAGACEDIEIESGGWKSGTYWSFKFGSQQFNLNSNGANRGLNLLVIDPATLTITLRKSYDTFASTTDSKNLATELGSVASGALVALICSDDCTKNTSAELNTAITALGSTKWGVSTTFRGSFALLALKGVGLISEAVSPDKHALIYWTICKSSVTTDVAAARGSCAWKGESGAESVCACNGRYYGNACQFTKTPGPNGSFVEQNVGSACSGNGVPNPFDGSCQCKTGYYHGPTNACEFKNCPKPTDSDIECGGNGHCMPATGLCMCNEDRAGAACEEFKCRAGNDMMYPSSNALVCSGNGACNVKNGKCECSYPYVGAICSHIDCPAKCNGRGSCDQKSGTCGCREPYYGNECEYTRCPNDCSAPGGGWCDNITGKCFCNDGFSGKQCLMAQQCDHSTALWNTSFDTIGWSTCPEGKLITGFFRNDCDALYCLEEASCATPCEGGVDRLTVGLCYQADWDTSFGKKGWSTCIEGSYLIGLYRSACNSLYCIDKARCCQILGGAVWAHCQDTNWWVTFNKKGWSYVPDTHFLVGLYRTDCHNLSCIEEARSCSFVR